MQFSDGMYIHVYVYVCLSVRNIPNKRNFSSLLNDIFFLRGKVHCVLYSNEGDPFYIIAKKIFKLYKRMVMHVSTSKILCLLIS